jgi:hypothetical protein
MSKLQYFDYPGFGEWARENNHYSQVVRIGNELRVSGQGQYTLHLLPGHVFLG